MIVFLDFDGVLNHAEWYRRRGPRPPGEGLTEAIIRWRLDPATAPRINRLADAGARFVISSTWRLGGLEEMRTILRMLGVRGEVIDCTPDLSVKSRSIHAHHGRHVNNTRGQEIQAWLDANGNPGPFVILDDDDDMGPLLDRLVHVGDRFGLLDEHVTRALELLGAPLTKAELRGAGVKLERLVPEAVAFEAKIFGDRWDRTGLIRRGSVVDVEGDSRMLALDAAVEARKVLEQTPSDPDPSARALAYGGDVPLVAPDSALQEAGTVHEAGAAAVPGAGRGRAAAGGGGLMQFQETSRIVVGDDRIRRVLPRVPELLDLHRRVQAACGDKADAYLAPWALAELAHMAPEQEGAAEKRPRAPKRKAAKRGARPRKAG